MISSAMEIAIEGNGGGSADATRAGIFIFVALLIIAAIVIFIQKSRRK